jgi:hypothetical protein
MIKIVDSSLGGYVILEDFQGLKVESPSGQTLAKVNSLNEALQLIATRLVLESDKTLSLAQYAQMRKDIFEKIVAAQEVETVQTEEING